MSLKPGEIYLAEAGGAAQRPVVIVSREELNRGKYVVAIPFTSANFAARSKQPNCVAFQAGDFGLTKDCVAQAEAISFIEITAIDLNTGPVGTLDEETMRDVVRAIGYVLSADCEPE